MQRRRSPPHTFEDNIAAEKARLQTQLAGMKPGPQMDRLMQKLRPLDTAANMRNWLPSPGLQAPK
jgi:hypothetical protein